MDISDIKALTFDTGGTILDWHSGFTKALKSAGEKYSLKKDWAKLANELRKRSLKKVVNLGEHAAPTHNFDDGHKMALEEIIADYNLEKFSEEDIYNISYKAPHNFTAWPDFPSALPILRKKYICASFTLLSTRLIIDTAKKNNLIGKRDSSITSSRMHTYKNFEFKPGTKIIYLGTPSYLVKLLVNIKYFLKPILQLLNGFNLTPTSALWLPAIILI